MGLSGFSLLKVFRFLGISIHGTYERFMFKRFPIVLREHHELKKYLAGKILLNIICLKFWKKPIITFHIHREIFPYEFM